MRLEPNEEIDISVFKNGKWQRINGIEGYMTDGIVKFVRHERGKDVMGGVF